MIDEIHDPVYIKDADGKFMFVNQAMARLGKRTTDEWIGKDSNEIFGPDIGNEALEMDKRAMESAYPFTYEKSSDAGGLMRHYLITKCRWLDGDGTVGGLVGISRDISSLKEAEQVVRDGEQHVREVMDSLSVVVVVLNVDGRVYEMNRMAREIFAEEGLKTAQVIGTPLTSLQWFSASPEVRETMVHTISRAAEGQRIHLNNVALLHHGRAVLYDVVLAPMHDQAGIVNHLILSAVDVSERKVAEEKSQEHQAQLAHLERVQTMGHMASGLAHELNQPLAAIVNYAGACRQIIAGGKAGMTDLDSVFGDILTEATRAGAIIRRLRGFVQKQRPQAVAVDINSLVNEAMRIFSYEFRTAQVVARQNLEANLPYVMADPVQITQVLVNLLRNAVDAMRDLDTGNKRLTVCTESIREGVRVLVVDSGIGIPQEQMGKLFDAFYTTKANGLGIGLALCRMIIENHGGQISGQTNPQGGMIFSFTLRHGEQSAGE
jgi:two-component system sensor kinase FixL